MPDSTITGLPDATLPLSGSERIAMDQDGATVSAGAFVTGQAYRIAVVGSTDFTAVGAASNTVGLIFTATGPGAGSGTAVAVATVDATVQDLVNAFEELGSIADGIIFTISNRGEVATPSTNYDESLPLSLATTVTKITFITHIDNTGSSTTTLSAYKRTAAGTKTALLSANATLTSGASVVVGSLSSTPGVLSLAVGDRLGVDLIGLGTGASGLKCIIEYTRPAA